MCISLRLGLLKYMGTTLLDKLKPSQMAREKFWAVLETHAKYRANLSPYPLPGGGDPPAPDLTWRAQWPRSLITFFGWVEGVIYLADYEATLRTAARHSKGPADAMEYDSFNDKWRQVLSMCDAERTAEAGGGAPDALCASDTGALARPGEKALAVGADEAAGTDALQQEAERTVKSNIFLMIEPDSQTELKQKLLSSAVGKEMGSEAGGQCPQLRFVVAAM